VDGVLDTLAVAVPEPCALADTDALPVAVLLPEADGEPLARALRDALPVGES
jgi:hypothetical protein